MLLKKILVTLVIKNIHQKLKSIHQSLFKAYAELLKTLRRYHYKKKYRFQIFRLWRPFSKVIVFDRFCVDAR